MKKELLRQFVKFITGKDMLVEIIDDMIFIEGFSRDRMMVEDNIVIVADALSVEKMRRKVYALRYIYENVD